MPGFVLEKFGLMEVRADFGPVYLINFAAVAYGLAWLLIAGPRHQSPVIQKIASTLTSLFTLSFLQLLGRHSLQIYVWHVLIVYMVYYLDARTPELSQLTRPSSPSARSVFSPCPQYGATGKRSSPTRPISAAGSKRRHDRNTLEAGPSGPLFCSEHVRPHCRIKQTLSPSPYRGGAFRPHDALIGSKHLTRRN